MRLVKFGRGLYIDPRRIMRWEIGPSVFLGHCKVRAIMEDQRMFGIGFLGIGVIQGRHEYHEWIFDTEAAAEQFVAANIRAAEQALKKKTD